MAFAKERQDPKKMKKKRKKWKTKWRKINITAKNLIKKKKVTQRQYKVYRLKINESF